MDYITRLGWEKRKWDLVMPVLMVWVCSFNLGSCDRLGLDLPFLEYELKITDGTRIFSSLAPNERFGSFRREARKGYIVCYPCQALSLLCPTDVQVTHSN